MCGLNPALPVALTPVFWWSIGLGCGLGVLYIAASLATNRFALRSGGAQRFLLVVVGGMLARMVAALLLVALVVLLVPVEHAAFIGSFFGVFVIGLVIEVWSIHRRRPPTREG